MRARFSILAVCSLVACNDPNPGDLGTEASSSESSSADPDATTTLGTTTATASSGPADTTEGVSAGSSSTGPAGSSSGEPGTTTTGDGGSSSGSGTTDDGGSSSGDSGTTGEVAECEPTNPDGDMICGDGIVVAGQLCYELEPPLQNAGTFATRVWAGDLDEDGDPDAMVLLEFPAELTVLLNDGTGTLAIDDSYPLAMGANTGSAHVDVGDMDGDGWVDAVVAFGAPASLRVLTNDGGGALGAPIATPLPLAPRAVAVADLDGDGLHDAVVADAVGITVHPGLGTGSFGLATAYTELGLVQARALAVHDFDDDGDLDVAAAFDNTIAVFPNDGGALLAPSTLAVAGAVNGPNDLAVGDVSADGIPDLVVSMNGVRLLAGVGDGTFLADPTPRMAGRVVVGDANADCVPDIFTRTAPLMFDELTIYPGDGLGGTSAPQSFLLHSGMVDMTGADFDGDGLTDILFAIGPTGNVGVSLTEP